ncbi:MAG: FkbM family methyltransferase [Ignisphaera sp.]|uniref:Methyltransferase n=1 Tax=Ligamenvirales sp. TaxID=2832923 RepID=A0AAU6PX66_9VIRU
MEPQFEVAVSWDGFKWFVSRDERLKHSVEVLSKGELSVLRALRSIASKDMIFCDVGAFVGYYTCRLAPYVREVHSFEPNPVSRTILLKNVELNGLGNVKVHPYALGDKSEVKKLYLMASGSTLLEGYGGLEVVDVEVKPMDDVVDWADLVKIDVEGYEWNVVRGMMNIIRRCKPVIVIEHHDFRHYRIATYDLIKNTLKAEGYIPVYITEPHRLYWHSSKPISEIRDIIVDHWINYCIMNIKEGKPWYYGLPCTWWWGMNLVDFIHELPEHVDAEYEWVKRLDP